jgi:hypothetical protein
LPLCQMLSDFSIAMRTPSGGRLKFFVTTAESLSAAERGVKPNLRYSPL